MTETPRTQAGRALLDGLTSFVEGRPIETRNRLDALRQGILAIEAEAGDLAHEVTTVLRESLAEAAAAPVALPRWWDSVVRRAIYSGNNDDLTVRQLRQKLAAENPHGR